MTRRSMFLAAFSLWAAGMFSAQAATVAPDPNAAPAAGQQGVYFVSPANGATVTSPVKLQFGVVGMSVAPAGQQASDVGHYHLLINQRSIDEGYAVPADDTHIHFDKGQTETELKLAPGTYQLTLQFADGYQLSYGAEMSATLSITVK